MAAHIDVSRHDSRLPANILAAGFILVAAAYFYFNSLALTVAGLESGDVTFFAPGAIGIAALPILVFCLVAGVANRRAFVILLPFVMLAFPAAINDLAPSMYIGPASEGGAAPFPLITHIDIYLLVGLMAHGRNRLAGYRRSGVIVALTILLLIQSAVSIAVSKNLADAALLATGNHHARFLVMSYLLVRTVPECFDLRLMSVGLVLALGFLFCESLINTVVAGYDRLASGTLGNNAFAQVISAITIFFIFAPRGVLSADLARVRIALIGIGVAIVVFTGTRAALVNLLVVSLALTFLSGRSRQILPILGLTIVAVLGVWGAGQAERFSVAVTTASAISEGEVDELTAATSSIFTRLTLYRASAAMINDHPLIGVGAGRWNDRKTEYGVPFDTLLDPHNGYLAFLSQYGSIAGTGLILVLLILPVGPCLRFLYGGEVNPVAYAGIIPLAMLLPELTNASSFKVGIGAFFAYVAVLVIGAPGVVLRARQAGDVARASSIDRAPGRQPGWPPHHQEGQDTA